MNDPINKPAHYTQGLIEVIEAIEDWKLNYRLGNVVKYVARAEHKGNALEDLKKAQWFLAREIAARESEPEASYTGLTTVRCNETGLTATGKTVEEALYNLQVKIAGANQ